MLAFEAYASGSSGNAYAARSGGAVLGIEAGLPIARLRRAHGHRLSRLDGMLITHWHGDHAQAARRVAESGVWLLASGPTLTELALAGHHRALRLEAGVPALCERWRILPFAVPHDADGAMGFLIEEPGGPERLLFVTDAAYLPGRLPPVEIIALECNYDLAAVRGSTAHPSHKERVLRNHMGLERVVATLKAAPLERCREIWLLHVSRGHGDPQHFQRVVSEEVGVPVRLAAEGLSDNRSRGRR